MPSSQQLGSSHFWHVEPKKPGAHCSHCEPEKPVAHAQVPLPVHAPPDAQAGEQDVDWTEEKARSGASAGSWAVSGEDANRTIEDDDDLNVTAVLGGIANEAGRRGEDRFEDKSTSVDSPP